MMKPIAEGEEGVMVDHARRAAWWARRGRGGTGGSEVEGDMARVVEPAGMRYRGRSVGEGGEVEGDTARVVGPALPASTIRQTYGMCSCRPMARELGLARDNVPFYRFGNARAPHRPTPLC